VISGGEDDGKIRWIYSHFDGYPEGVGKTLNEHYADPERIAELIALGSVSILGPEIGEKHDFDEHPRVHKDWCLFYRRDRGEPWDHVKPEVDSREAFTRQDGICYLYLHDGNEWKVLYLYADHPEFESLTDVLDRLEAEKQKDAEPANADEDATR
jgi:hypothetical protein